MGKYEIEAIYGKRNYNTRLKDSYKVLSILVSMANGIVWKEKEKSFYKIIANELKEIFDNKLLSGIKLKKITKSFYKTSINDTNILFIKNNIFSDEEELIEISDFLNQKLVEIDKKLPDYITSNQLNELLPKLNEEEKKLVKNAYPMQELNTNKFYLKNTENEKKIIYIFNKFNYFSINIIDYINIIHDNYDYNYTDTDYKDKLFKDTFNNYILELGAYIAKVIKENTND